MPQVDLMNFRVEYVRPLSGRCLGREAAERRVLNKQDEGLFRKSTSRAVKTFLGYLIFIIFYENWTRSFYVKELYHLAL